MTLKVVYRTMSQIGGWRFFCLGKAIHKENQIDRRNDVSDYIQGKNEYRYNSDIVFSYVMFILNMGKTFTSTKNAILMNDSVK